MNKKTFKEKPKGSKKFQQKANLAYVPSTNTYEIYEPHLPRKQTNVQGNLIITAVIVLSLVCTLVFCLESRKTKRKKQKKNLFQ